MDLIPETENKNNEEIRADDAHIKGYTIAIKHWFWPFLWIKHKCYRHEVAATNHLVLYRIDRSQRALPVARASWIVYPDYWLFMKQLKK